MTSNLKKRKKEFKKKLTEINAINKLYDNEMIELNEDEKEVLLTNRDKLRLKLDKIDRLDH